jgi:hypothetical protein
LEILRVIDHTRKIFCSPRFEPFASAAALNWWKAGEGDETLEGQMVGAENFERRQSGWGAVRH